jgi:hypothetical protein
MRGFYSIKQILKIQGRKLGTRFIWLTIGSNTMWHWCTFVCVKGEDSLTRRRTYIFRSGFYTTDSVSWFWWYVVTLTCAAKSNMTKSFNTNSFIRLLCKRWWNFVCFEIQLLWDLILVTDCPSLHWSWHFVRDQQKVTCKGSRYYQQWCSSSSVTTLIAKCIGILCIGVAEWAIPWQCCLRCRSE